MCDALTPMAELEALKFSVSALAESGINPGSYDSEMRRNAARGIRARIQWVMKTLEAAGEGKQNMGV